MRILSRSYIAVRHVRMLLIRAGLSETDADAFLDRLEAEVVAGHLEDQEARRKFIEHELAKLGRQLTEVRRSQRRSPGRLETIITALAANALYDVLKSRFESGAVDTANPTASGSLPAPAKAQFTQQAKLVGTNAVGGANQGHSVSLSADGNTAIVGGWLDNNNIGAAWVYTRFGGLWTQQGEKLVGANDLGPALQGYSSSLSADGNTAIVGGYYDNSGAGAAWVFRRSGEVWGQQAKLVGTGAIGSAFQGNSVALAADGNTAIVGGSTDNLLGNNSIGAAWVFTRSGGAWSQQAKLIGTGAIAGDYNGAAQGVSVSLSADGNTAIIGGPYDDNRIGATWVFTRSGGIWGQQAKLVGTGAIGPDGSFQGFSVSLSADGNTAIIGGPFDNYDQSSATAVGAAWVFTRSNGVWAQQGPKLIGTAAIGNSKQGWSVSLSGNGNIALVGGLRDDNGIGSTWVYTRSNGVWSQEAKLVGAGISGPVSPLQGAAVALSGDGSAAIIGGPNDNDLVGAAWVFTHPGSCIG